MDLAVDAIMVIVMVIVTAIKQLITMITDASSAVVLDPHVMMTIDHRGHGCGVMVMISQIQTLNFDQGGEAMVMINDLAGYKFSNS